MNYICSVEKPLGSLTFMRIWHDNSGRGKQKSWFLDQVQITDLQTGDRYILTVKEETIDLKKKLAIISKIIYGKAGRPRHIF